MTDIPFHFSKTPGNITRGVPNLGEHTTEILGEIGYSKAEISALNAAFG